MKAIAKGLIVIVLMIGLRQAFIGKIMNATLASMVARKLSVERASAETRVKVIEESRFVTIIAISRTIMVEELSVDLEILDEFLTVTIIAIQNIVNVIILMVLIQTYRMEKGSDRELPIGIQTVFSMTLLDKNNASSGEIRTKVQEIHTATIACAVVKPWR